MRIPTIGGCNGRILAGCVLGFAACSILLGSRSASADHFVTRHTLECEESFSCPAELRPRVDFWAQVFHQWSTSNAVLHDPNLPHRVYSVIDTVAGCSAEKSKTVRAELKRVRGLLRSVAGKLEQGQPKWTVDEAHLVALFPARRAADIRAAADRIRCQQGNRDRFAEALRRYGRYGGMVRSILRDQGLPADIQYLPFVESAYNPAVYSRVGAAGMWQLMPATARLLGVNIDATMDERLDPESATRAAAKYLIDSRKVLERAAAETFGRQPAGTLSPFVITSYNYGVAGMRRALTTAGPDFMDVLSGYRSPSFQLAVKNFYASFLAARHVAKNAATYFGPVPPLPALRYDTVVLNRPTSFTRIKRTFAVDEEMLRELNPALTRFVWQDWRLISEGYPLRLPVRQGGWTQRVAALNALPAEGEARYAHEYKVRRGDTACGIAHAFRVNCRDLIAVNRLGRKGVIRAGQSLTIPGRAGGSSAPTTAVTQVAGSAGQVRSYTVRPGDTTCAIAAALGVSCRQLIAKNGLGTGGMIRIGQKLSIPGGASSPSSAGRSGPVIHTVRRGDTACIVARRYAVSCQSVIAANGLGRKALITVGQTLTIPGTGGSGAVSGGRAPRRYTVRPGDTACEIARRFGTSCPQLLTANGLGKSALIRIGQVIEVPGAATATGPGRVSYTVRPGDTPCGIAARLSVNCRDLLNVNGLGSRSVIHPGQVLQVPDGSRATSLLMSADRSAFSA